MSGQELLRIEVSQPRRAIGAGALVGLGGLLLYIALTEPPAPGWLVFLLALGGGSLWFASVLWQATQRALILTEEALEEEGGAVIARLDEVVRIDRGMLAMKPSNGFSLLLRTRGARAWRPGLWWRWGRRVAVGGVTSGHQTRPVADIIAIKIAERAVS